MVAKGDKPFLLGFRPPLVVYFLLFSFREDNHGGQFLLLFFRNFVTVFFGNFQGNQGRPLVVFVVSSTQLSDQSPCYLLCSWG